MIRFLIALSVLMLTSCTSLPTSAPTVGQLVRTQQGEPVVVRDITPEIAAGTTPALSADAGWSLTDAPAMGDLIAVGDVLGINIFEMGYGLFTAGGTAADNVPGLAAPRAGGRALPPITVPESGMIDLPYIGSIRADGQSATELTTEIERRMKGKSQFAQALVTLTHGPARRVILSGDVKQPGQLMLSASQERLRDAVALAGGPTGRVPDTIIRLTRGDVTNAIRMSQLTPDSIANVRLAPGDRIELVRNARTFAVLGAAKTISEIAFESDRLTLIEALSRAGGPTDDKADATGVFVFRYESRADGSGEQPVIYRLDLLRPQSYFAAQRFLMQEKDVLLIANARSNQLGKFVQLLNGLTGPALLLDVATR
jgi:polysaccharide biosynthesis/export protein